MLYTRPQMYNYFSSKVCTVWFLSEWQCTKHVILSYDIKHVRIATYLQEIYILHVSLSPTMQTILLQPHLCLLSLYIGMCLPNNIHSRSSLCNVQYLLMNRHHVFCYSNAKVFWHNLPLLLSSNTILSKLCFHYHTSLSDKNEVACYTLNSLVWLLLLLESKH